MAELGAVTKACRRFYQNLRGGPLYTWAMILPVLLAVFAPASALAQTTASEMAVDSGATAWILAASALVLFMTLPGLALFYAGLVRQKNALSVMMQCLSIGAVGSVLWLLCAYSLAFSGEGAWLGDLAKLAGLGMTRTSMVGILPEPVFFLYQMTFAVITPALMVGAYVERIKFGPVLVISALWLLLVYAPVTHWVWGGGFLAKMGVMDFAGGLVVHATAGVGALVIAAMLGPRDGYPREIHAPHNPGMTFIGAAMLWVGWFGFNGGSALAADGNAGMAIVATHLSAATATMVWAGIEWAKFGKPSAIGAVTGAVAGLATVTPASGFIGPIGGVILGAAGALVCFYAVGLMKKKTKIGAKIDDSLDVFAVHGVGGILGTILVAFLAAPTLGGVGWAITGSASAQLGVQLIGVAIVVVFSAVLTWAIVALVKPILGLRASDGDIDEGLDLSHHGERLTHQG